MLGFNLTGQYGNLLITSEMKGPLVMVRKATLVATSGPLDVPVEFDDCQLVAISSSNGTPCCNNYMQIYYELATTHPKVFVASDYPAPTITFYGFKHVEDIVPATVGLSLFDSTGKCTYSSESKLARVVYVYSGPKSGLSNINVPILGRTLAFVAFTEPTSIIYTSSHWNVPDYNSVAMVRTENSALRVRQEILRNARIGTSPKPQANCLIMVFDVTSY